MANAPKKKKQARRSFRYISGRAKAALLVLLCMALLVIAALLVHYTFWITDIQVEGNERLEDEYIISLAGIVLGQHSLQMDEEAIRERFEAEPYISLDKVEMAGPSRIILYVQERRALAVAEMGGQYLVLAEDGMVLETRTESGDLPVATGLSITFGARGQLVQGADKYQLHAFAQTMKAFLDSEVAEEITGIDLSVPTAVKLKTQHNITIRVGLPEELDRKVLWTEDKLPTLIEENRHFGTLDVSGGSSASYIPDE